MKGRCGSLQRCHSHDVTVPSPHNFLYLPDPSRSQALAASEQHLIFSGVSFSPAIRRYATASALLVRVRLSAAFQFSLYCSPALGRCHKRHPINFILNSKTFSPWLLFPLTRCSNTDQRGELQLGRSQAPYLGCRLLAEKTGMTLIFAGLVGGISLEAPRLALVLEQHRCLLSKGHSHRWHRAACLHSRRSKSLPSALCSEAGRALTHLK